MINEYNLLEALRSARFFSSCPTDKRFSIYLAYASSSRSTFIVYYRNTEHLCIDHEVFHRFLEHGVLIPKHANAAATRSRRSAMRQLCQRPTLPWLQNGSGYVWKLTLPAETL